MLRVVKEILGSKKAVVAITSAIVAGAARLGWHVDTETVGVFLTPIVAYLVGQGLADQGKEVAKAKL